MDETASLRWLFSVTFQRKRFYSVEKAKKEQKNAVHFSSWYMDDQKLYLYILVEYPAEIMLFPCNQFANQEPGTPEEIKEFVTARDVDAMLMEKVKVNGKDSSPVFQYLKVASGDTGPCTWNFKCKFLVRKDGTVEGRYGGYPLELEPKIKELLQQ